MLFVRIAALGALLLGAIAGEVQAQPFAPTINPNAVPIVVAQTPEKLALRPKIVEQTVMNLAFGTTLNAGNTRSFAGNLGGRFFQVHDNHQITLEALGTLGGARGERLTDVQWTSQTIIGRARYDHFLSQNDALFLALAPRHDRFAGLAIRLQSQTGYLRNLYRPSETHRVWSELGYDFTYDNFTLVEETTTKDVTTDLRNREVELNLPAGTLVPEGAMITQTIKTSVEKDPDFIHSARLFLGYTNRLFAAANLSAGVETLLDFVDKDNVRVNGLIELTSSITHSFKLGVQSRLLFDNEPVPGKDKLDSIVAMQLVYTFDSAAGVLNAPCPVCDCTSQVAAARASCRGEPSRQINP